jgi:hypothetical protein
VRVNSFSAPFGIKNELDNTSSSNIMNLQRQGQSWFHGKLLLQVTVKFFFENLLFLCVKTRENL